MRGRRGPDGRLLRGEKILPHPDRCGTGICHSTELDKLITKVQVCGKVTSVLFKCIIKGDSLGLVVGGWGEGRST